MVDVVVNDHGKYRAPGTGTYATNAWAGFTDFECANEHVRKFSNKTSTAFSEILEKRPMGYGTVGA